MRGELAQVYVLPTAATREPELTYEEASVELHVSTRFLRYRVSEGMPAHTDYAGRRRFVMSEVRPWLDEWQAKRRKAS